MVDGFTDSGPGVFGWEDAAPSLDERCPGGSDVLLTALLLGGFNGNEILPLLSRSGGSAGCERLVPGAKSAVFSCSKST